MQRVLFKFAKSPTQIRKEPYSNMLRALHQQQTNNTLVHVQRNPSQKSPTQLGLIFSFLVHPFHLQAKSVMRWVATVGKALLQCVAMRCSVLQWLWGVNDEQASSNIMSF